MLKWILILLASGIGIFIFGMNVIESELVMIIGACLVVTGILFILSAIAGYGKSEEEKQEIQRDLFNQFEDGMKQREQERREKRRREKEIEEAIRRAGRK